MRFMFFWDLVVYAFTSSWIPWKKGSAVINTLIAAASKTARRSLYFVELKARFDEENNLATAEMMQAAGIKIIYSIPGLKVTPK